MSRVKNYAKSKAKNYAKKKVKNLLLKTAPYWIPIVAILFIVLLITATLQSFLEDGAIADTLSKEDNQKLIQYSIDKAREVNGSMLDYYGTDEELSLNSALINSYYKYLQLNESEEQTLESIKRKLSTIAEKMKPEWEYIKNRRQVETIKTVTYEKIITKQYSYSLKEGVDATVYSVYLPSPTTVTTIERWTEKIKVTDVEPIYLLTKADTIKNTYDITYKMQKSTDYYENNQPKSKSSTFLNEKVEDKQYVKSTTQEIISKNDPQKTTNGTKPSYNSSIIVENCTTNEYQPYVVSEEINEVSEIIPVQDEFKSLNSKDYTRLEDMIKEENKDEDIAMVKAMIVNNAQSYINGQRNADWVFSEINDYENVAGFTSSAYIPAQLLPFFKEAEQRYNIPYWLLGAIAFRESSFNIHATSNVGCYGLMQLQPFNWEAIAPKLGFDVVADRDNPEAQILAGTHLLSGYIQKWSNKNPEQIDWQGEGWKDEIMPALAHYWGINDVEYCRRTYGAKVVETAQTYRNIDTFMASGTAKPIAGEIHITSPFGMRFHPVYNTWKMHNGIDIATGYGEPIFAVADGVITHAGNWGGGGLTVILKSGNYEFIYCHLSKIDVQVGKQVKEGEILGGTDSTGASTGNHLHFGTKLNGVYVDPLSVLPTLQ
ncbi:M23 family metallopeptidase [Caldicellulosiruptoraceae bacterium PP1]